MGASWPKFVEKHRTQWVYSKGIESVRTDNKKENIEIIMKKPQLFTSKRCVYCHMLESRLEESGIAFEKISLDDPKGFEIAMKEGVKSLPTVKVNDKVFVGFSEQNIEGIMDEVSKLREQVCGEKG